MSDKPAEMREAVNVLAGEDIIIGVTPETFAPDLNITRAEAAAFIVRLLGFDLDIPEESGYYSDVTASDWFYCEVYVSDRNNIITGFETEFLPYEHMIREDIFALAADVLKRGSDSESDIEAEAEREEDSLALVISENLVLPRRDGRLAPDENMTRGDFAVMLYRLYKKFN
jgi:hypothetical protein